MSRKKIVLQTNAPWARSGLGENGRYLMKHLLRTGKYEVVYYCTNGTLSNDPNLARLPCKAYGALPADQNVLNQLAANQGMARDVNYGSYFIDQIIKDEKPDIWWESDDIWSTNGYIDKSWFKQINSVFHKTPDSRPILDAAFQQARATPYYTVWSDFAEKEMKRVDPSLKHIKRIYGMFDTGHFAPITADEKLDLRKRFGLDPRTVIFHTTNRNQLRKPFPTIIEAFAAFKRANPKANAKLHFHTAFGEKAVGWDIEKNANTHGVKKEDILCTYVCRNCAGWHIAPYSGENTDCPHCGMKKAMVTPSVGMGVIDEEMKLMHGVFDAGLSIFNSGGLERFSIASLLCGLPTAISSYSCGEDFMHLPFVSPIDWTPYYQEGTNFIKATPKVETLVVFMQKVYTMSAAEKQRIGEQSRAWAQETFSVTTIGQQWEELFDSMPPKDWSTITLVSKLKNEQAPMPQTADNEQWIRALYKTILLVDPDPDGLKNWMAALEQGRTRDQIYQYFIQVARQDNAKISPPADFGMLFDSNGRKRILFVVKESGGDVFICTALFKGLKARYPDADLYIGTEPRFYEILAGNPYVHKVLAYHPMMDQELVMRMYVDYYICPTGATQTKLNYVTHLSPTININEEVLA